MTRKEAMPGAVSDILFTVLGDIIMSYLEALDSTLHDQKFVNTEVDVLLPHLYEHIGRPVILTWSCLSTVRSQKGPGSKSYQNKHMNKQKGIIIWSW